MIKFFWLGIILVFTFIIRLVGLADYPIGFTPDEAAFGYNAYSLLKTGRDEWGEPFWKLPITNLQSFGDYKLPLYALLTVPSVKMFGLSEFSTRLPNAVLGSLAVAVIFVFAGRLFPKSRAGLLSAFLLALSPWGISLSRGAFEANLVTFFLPLSLTLLVSKKTLPAIFILVLNFYSYHSARLLTLILLPLFLIKSKSVIHNSLFVILIIPGLISLFGSGSTRTRDVSIFSPTDYWRSVADRRFEAVQSGLPDFVSRIFSNKLVSSVSLLSKNYISYFSPNFLFTDGVRETTYGMFPGFGVLYWPEIACLFGFLLLLVSTFKKSKSLKYLLVLLLISPLPAILAKGSGYAANRSAALLPFLILASALGITFLSRSKKYLYYLFFILIFLNFIFFAETYIFHSRVLAAGMLYGRREMVQRVTAQASLYDRVYVNRSLSEPHIYFAFYNRIDPQVYQKSSLTWTVYHTQKLKFLDQYDGYSLGNFSFGDFHTSSGHNLFVGRPENFASAVTPAFTIDLPDGHPEILVSSSFQ